jgi:hypothetical protein
VGERSKAQSLPQHVREDLDSKLLAGGFSGYVQLQDWLRAQGFDISKSSLHRYGSMLEEKIAKLRMSAERAQALVAASPDAADNMGQATMRLLQEKLFTVLESMDDIDPESVDLVKLSRAMAPLVRASIAAKNHAADVATKLAEADKRVDAAASGGQLGDVTPQALAAIRAIYTGAVTGPGGSV